MQRVAVDQRIVDIYHTAVDFFHRAHGLVHIGGEDRGAEAEARIVGMRDAFIHISHTADSGHRSEYFVAHNRHIRCDAAQDGRLIIPADIVTGRDAPAALSLGAGGNRAAALSRAASVASGPISCLPKP